MSKDHPNIALLARFNPADINGCADIFADDVIWHFFNPLVPDLHGDYFGCAGIQDFFDKVALLTSSAFEINPISITAIGDELLVVHRKQTMTLGGQRLESDVVVVWRIVDGKVSEVWDIPSIHAVQASQI